MEPFDPSREDLTQSRATPDDAPIGYVDRPPATEFEVSNSLLVEGWALDRGGKVRVTIEREPRPGDITADLNPRGMVTLGLANAVVGTRPDVSKAFPDYPGVYSANWSFELSRNAISSQNSFRATIRVIAENDRGAATMLGRRELIFLSPARAPPYLFCGRPFDSVFIEPNGDVKPYPDCRPEQPYGSLVEPGVTLEQIWFGPAFTQLRQSIIDRDPPPMCRTCAHFINRNVNDPDYFATR
jgi:Iron-sulfur cluster-binding domain